MRAWRGGASAGALVVVLGVLATPAWGQRPDSRRTPRPEASRERDARAPARASVPSAWDDEDPLGPEDALEARRDAILRWHEQRRAWLQARRDGWPAVPDGYAEGDDAPAGAVVPGRMDAVARRAGTAYGRTGPRGGAESWRGATGFDRRPSAFCLSFGPGSVWSGFGDDGWGRSWSRRCGGARGWPRPYPGAIPPGYLPYPSLDPYAYPFPNPAVYPVPHRFERRFHPDEPASREAPDYPADPWAGAYAPMAYGYGGVYGYADPFGGGGYGNGDFGYCVVVTGATGAGSYFEVVVDPASLGARSGREVVGGIEQRLGRGASVVLRGVDGVEVRLAPGARGVRLAVEGCGR